MHYYKNLHGERGAFTFVEPRKTSIRELHADNDGLIHADPLGEKRDPMPVSMDSKKWFSLHWNDNAKKLTDGKRTQIWYYRGWRLVIDFFDVNVLADLQETAIYKPQTSYKSAKRTLLSELNEHYRAFPLGDNDIYCIVRL